jgi:hypothetical protein
LPSFRPAKIFVQQYFFNQFVLAKNNFVIGPFWRFLARFLARLKKLKLLLAALALCFWRRGVKRSRVRGPARGHGVSIFLGGGNPFQPEIYV